MARKIYAAEYSRNAVLEIKEAVKTVQRGDWKEYHGRVVVRAATLETGDRHKEVMMSLSPVECYRLGLVIKQIVKSQQPVRKKVIIHQPEEGKFSELIAEYWRNNNREGYAIILQLREGDNVTVKVNVPIEKINFLALGDFFQSLNTLLRWRELKKVESSDSNEQEVPEEEPLEIDDDLDDIDL